MVVMVVVVVGEGVRVSRVVALVVVVRGVDVKVRPRVMVWRVVVWVWVVVMLVWV